MNLDHHSKLVERPLTAKQRHALEVVASGRYRTTHVRIGRALYEDVMAYNGALIGGQIKALKRRRFVKGFGQQLNVTLAGAFELYFDPGALT